jgi:predicted Zn finger-like uncharacterized protein
LGVVVSCQKCRTRFQLDEARIPAKGVRVRCSKCKHAFFVAPPGQDAKAIHDLAEDAATTGRPAKPRAEPAVDLRSKESEDDWQFNIEPPGADGPGAPTSPPPAPAEFTDSEPVEGAAEMFFELDGLPRGGRDEDATDAKSEPPPEKKAGKKKKSVPPPIEPEQEVDFRTLGKPAPAPARPPAPPAAKGKKIAKEKTGAASDAAQDAPRAARATLPRVDPGAWVGSLGGAAGWALAALLFALGVNGAMSPPRGEAELAPVAIGGLEITDLRVRHLENLYAGPLVVVAGELRNPGADGARAGAAPFVRVTDAYGEALDLSPVWIGGEIGDDALRRSDPAPLAIAQADSARALAQRSFAANERVRVTALLADLPPEAVGFRIESVPVAELRSAAPPPEPVLAPEPAAPPEGTNDGAPIDAP